MSRRPNDTHTYDGQLKSNLIPDLALIAAFPLAQKKQCGAELIERASAKTPAMKPGALHFLRQIVNAIGTGANIDSTNGLVADDLICLCWKFKDDPHFLVELEIQLQDMATGFCAQGRTHRLFQILLPMIQIS
jgi:hypothetical protein